MIAPATYAAALVAATRDMPEHEVSAAVRRLAASLAERNLAALLPAIASAVPDAVKRDAHTETVTVETARPIDADEIAVLLAAAGVEPGTEIEVLVRPDLVGGARIRRGDTLLDASVRGRLDALRKVR